MTTPVSTPTASAFNEEMAAFGVWADTAPVLLWITDPEGRCVYVSRRWHEFTGQPAGAGLGWGWAEMIHPEDRERVVEEFQHSCGGPDPFVTEYRLRHCSGEYRWVADSAEPKFDAAGRLVGYVGAVMDVTERRHAQVMLERSRLELSERLAELEAYLEAVPVGIALIGRNGKYVRVNRAVARLHGIEPEAHIGRTPTEVGCLVAEQAETLVRRVVETGQPVLEEERLPAAGPDGRELVWLLSCFPVRNAAGEVVAVGGVLQDLTEVTRLRDQLAQAQKMESIGRLAGGVAHDFNNLLTVMGGYAHQALDRLGPGEPARLDIAQIQAAVDRAAEFTRQLLSFARRQVVQPKALDLGEVLSANEELVRRLIGEDIRLVIRKPERPAPVLMDPGQCTQILLNLAANARDAMPKGGSLTIAAELVTLAPSAIPSGETARPGPFVRLTVTDTGVGMPADVRRRVFEPFFTTKSSGRGIGLASCYGFVKQAGGLIGVTSTEGGGTTFTIHLPMTSEPIEPAPAAAPHAVTSAGRESVLLVEDEPMVREMLGRVLRLRGYQVTDAASTEQALRLAQEAARPFDLVIADVVLPGGSGLDLADSIVEAKPNSRVLLMSGYAGHRPPRKLPYRLIAKPFDLEQFLQTVRSVLDTPRA